jgi:hypothetical protein
MDTEPPPSLEGPTESAPSTNDEVAELRKELEALKAAITAQNAED